MILPPELSLSNITAEIFYGRNIEIRGYGDTYVGSVTFNESPQRLHAERTADGFRLQIPILLSFKLVPKGEPMPLVGNLRGMIYTGGTRILKS